MKHIQHLPVKSECKREQSRVTSEELPKPVIHKMLIDFSDREQASFCNSCMVFTFANTTAIISLDFYMQMEMPCKPLGWKEM